jgi:hypothetical protein
VDSTAAARVDAPPTPPPAREGGPLRRALQRLTRDREELVDDDLQQELASAGATAVTQCPQGGRVRVAGSLRSVRLCPKAGLPTLEAELYDGTGSVTLVWLGRRRIAGIECGRSLVAHGRIVELDGRRVIYNPAYDLRPAGPASGE